MATKRYSDIGIYNLKNQLSSFGFKVSYHYNSMLGHNFEVVNPSHLHYSTLDFSPTDSGTGFYISTTSTWIRNSKDAKDYALEILFLQQVLEVVESILERESK